MKKVATFLSIATDDSWVNNTVFDPITKKNVKIKDLPDDQQIFYKPGYKHEKLPLNGVIHSPGISHIIDALMKLAKTNPDLIFQHSLFNQTDVMETMTALDIVIRYHSNNYAIVKKVLDYMADHYDDGHTPKVSPLKKASDPKIKALIDSYKKKSRAVKYAFD